MADEEGANSNRRQSTLTPPTILAFLREFTSYMMIKGVHYSIVKSFPPAETLLTRIVFLTT
jgi:hypothetical protein